jgi:AAA+ ATPase superfamily predicted ATPase
MDDLFVNRERELAALDRAAADGGLLVVFGRRRVGKTRLLREWLQQHDGAYTQAIEAPVDLQLEQVMQDIRLHVATDIVPKSWAEVLEVLALQKKPWRLCLDEFPYLTSVDSSLPSRLQRFLDHQMPKGCLLMLSGSSTGMMHNLFLHRAAPLYGRARRVLHVTPMDYAAFCRARRLDPEDADSFERFAMVGGIPKYWEFVDAEADAVALAEALFFGFSSYMEQEPHQLLRDEGVAGLNALAVLEAVGRGAERPSEIASRLNTKQTNLSRLLQQLLDASMLTRELPYGESVRSTKRVLYRIVDPSTRFWFRVYSPHQSRWLTYAVKEKRTLIHAHAASVFEDICRAQVLGAQRYWESGAEFDLVGVDPQNDKGLLVAEIKWRHVTPAERRRLTDSLTQRWARTSVAARHPRVRFDVIDAGILGDLGRRPRARRS